MSPEIVCLRELQGLKLLCYAANCYLLWTIGNFFNFLSIFRIFIAIFAISSKIFIIFHVIFKLFLTHFTNFSCSVHSFSNFLEERNLLGSLSANKYQTPNQSSKTNAINCHIIHGIHAEKRPMRLLNCHWHSLEQPCQEWNMGSRERKVRPKQFSQSYKI